MRWGDREEAAEGDVEDRAGRLRIEPVVGVTSGGGSSGGENGGADGVDGEGEGRLESVDGAAFEAKG